MATVAGCHIDGGLLNALSFVTIEGCTGMFIAEYFVTD